MWETGINGIPCDHWGIWNSNFWNDLASSCKFEHSYTLWISHCPPCYIYPRQNLTHVLAWEFHGSSLLRSKKLEQPECHWEGNEWMIVYLDSGVLCNSEKKKITVGVTTWQLGLFSCPGVRKAGLRSWHTIPFLWIWKTTQSKQCII